MKDKNEQEKEKEKEKESKKRGSESQIINSALIFKRNIEQNLKDNKSRNFEEKLKNF